MDQWISGLEKWSSAHQSLVNLIQAIAPYLGISLLTLVAAIVKPIRTVIVTAWLRIWSWRKGKLGRPDLRFVAIPPHCFFSALRGSDGRLSAEIHTRWHVTNASGLGMSAKLLRARIAKTQLPEVVVPEMILVDGSPQGSNYDTVPPGQTLRVTIRITVPFPSGRPIELIPLQIVVTDQLGHEHRLPKVTLRNMTPEPAANPHVPTNQAKSPSITKTFKVRVQLPSVLWEVIVEFSGEMVKGNTEQRLRQLAGEAAIEVLNRRWDQLNPDGPDLPNFTPPNFARDVMTKPLSEFEVSSIPEDVVRYQLSVDLRAWIINGPA